MLSGIPKFDTSSWFSTIASGANPAASSILLANEVSSNLVSGAPLLSEMDGDRSISCNAEEFSGTFAVVAQDARWISRHVLANPFPHLTCVIDFARPAHLLSSRSGLVA